MSARLSYFAIALCGLCLALFFIPTWNPRAVLALFLVLLSGAALARSLFESRDKTEAQRAAAGPEAKASRVGHSPLGRADAQADILFRATMNSMREGVLVLDQELRVVAFNRAARAIFDNAAEPLEHKRLSELTRRPAIHSAFHRTLEGGERVEVKVELGDAARRIFELHVEPLGPGYEGDWRGAIGVFFDITRLERLERVRQEFLSNVSHELRTPLTSIIAYVETLEDGAMEDRENNRRFLEIIRKNAARMHNLIDDILELSAIEAGNAQIAPERVSLHSVVSEIKTGLASRAGARKVAVRNEVRSDKVVLADPRRLEQMLTNLIDNAIKFNREGGYVRITCEREDGRDRISIRDTGDGIAAEHLERIFERFYRVDRARSRELGGTGLGLAIVKHLVHGHGGEISVQSSPGEGSTFIIELPAESENKG